MQQVQGQQAAVQQPRPTTAGRDVRTELQRKEHELSHLRMAALRALEQQVHWMSGNQAAALLYKMSKLCQNAVAQFHSGTVSNAVECSHVPTHAASCAVYMTPDNVFALQLSEAQVQYQHLQLQFEELKTDFQYNLQLLAERDAELEQADAAASTAAAELAAKSSNITQLQAQLAQAQSGESTTVHYNPVEAPSISISWPIRPDWPGDPLQFFAFCKHASL